MEHGADGNAVALAGALHRTSGDVLRNFGGKNVSGLRGAYERLLKMGYGFSIIASVPLIMGNFQARAPPAKRPTWF